MQPKEGKDRRPEVIFLDIYETLLDMTEVERRLNHLLDSRYAYTLWFELLMQHCFANNCFSTFHPFSSIAKATMQMTSRMLGRNIEESAVNDLLVLLEHLPVHDGVPQGLSQLKDAGYILIALTNASAKIVRNRMEPTGLVSYFDAVLSTDQVKKYKPAKEVYDWALKQSGTDASASLMLSSHGWDLAGAGNAGMRTAFLEKNHRLLYPLAPEPDYRCRNLQELADQLSGYNDA